MIYFICGSPRQMSNFVHITTFERENSWKTGEFKEQKADLKIQSAILPNFGKGGAHIRCFWCIYKVCMSPTSLVLL